MFRRTVSAIVIAMLLTSTLALAFNLQPAKANASSRGETTQATGTDWWPMFHHDLNHTGYSTSTGPNTNALLWNYSAIYTYLFSPAIAEGKLYIGSEDGKLYCLNATTGRSLWNYSTPVGEGPEDITSSPTVADGRVYFGAYWGHVYCVDANTGTLIWVADTGYYVYNSPAVFDGKVYIGTALGRFFCYNSTTGETIWVRVIGAGEEPGDPIYTSAAVAYGRVYFKTVVGEIYCLDAGTGTTLWKKQVGASLGFFDSSPAVVDGKVYIGSGTDNCVSCINAFNGQAIWQYPTGSIVRSSPALAYGRVYVGSSDTRVYCLDATTGSFVWSYTTGNEVLSSPAVADGRVYVGSHDNEIYCINASTGGQIWNYSTDAGVYSSAAVAQGKVYITGGYINSRVYCFGSSHDIAVSRIVPSRTIIGEGFSLSIYVAVANQGCYAETCNVTTYVNATQIYTKTVNLTSGNSTTITFTWNTVGFAKGNYTLWSYVEPVQGETYTSDNRFIYGTITVTILGDVDGDFNVDILDIVKITGIYASKLGDLGFNPNSDINGDGQITILDVVLCTGHYGQKWP